MFTPETFVDNVQDAKLAVVKHLPFDEKFKSQLVDFVEAQRTFVKTNIKLAQSFSANFANPAAFTTFFKN